ncbi:MAG TPA: peptidoglycan-binding protein, partial [Oscillatoriaceae cyanobacterium]
APVATASAPDTSNFNVTGLPSRPMSAGMDTAPSGGAAVPTAAAPVATAAAPLNANHIQTEITQLQKQLAAIQAQCKALMAQFGTKPAPTPTKPSKPKPKPGSGPTLKEGDTGAPVRALQQRLQKLGFNPQGIDGDFGPHTEAALKAFQKAKHLKVTGTADKQTWAALGVQVKGKVNHPHIKTGRSFYIQQPNGWTCGPTSLTMALAAWGVRPADGNTINEMVRRTGATSSTGVPGNASLIANAAKQVGMQAKYNPVGSPANVRAALKAGHGVVLNGSLGIGGHFIYVAGLNADGTFQIDDPARPTVTRMTDSELNAFANTYSNPRGFAEIWK